MADTKGKLLDATAECVRQNGVAALSARTIAARAGVNQALVFYHFGTVSELVEAACRAALDAAIDRHRADLAQVGSLTELLEAGRRMHDVERAAGSVAMMGQLMSGAIRDPVLARAAREAMDQWCSVIEPVVTRLLRGSPLAALTDAAGLTRAICASFIGIELYESADPDGAAAALAALENLAILTDVVDSLGAVGRRAVRARVARTSRRSSGAGPISDRRH